MDKLATYCTILFLVSGCATQSLDHSISVTAEASAVDCDTALRRAKTEAADNVAGTFIHGQRTLVQDRQYSESLKEYSSGVIQKYTLLEKRGFSPCTIKIQAWVEPGKNSLHLYPKSTKIGAEDVKQRSRQIADDRKFIARHFRETAEFSVEMEQMKVLEERSGYVQLDIKVVAIQPPQQWLTDLENYVRTHSAVIVYKRETFLHSIVSQIFTDKNERPQNDYDPEICFVQKDESIVNCYVGEDNIKVMQSLNALNISIQVIKDGSVLQEKKQFVPHLRLYSEQTFKANYRAKGYQPRNSFPVIKAAPMPIDASIFLRGLSLPEGATIQGRANF